MFPPQGAQVWYLVRELGPTLLFNFPVMSDSLWLHELQHAMPLCPSASHKVSPSSCPLHQGCHPAISSSDTLFSFCPQSFPASGTFPMSQLFISNEQTTGVSTSASVLPTSIQGGFPLRLVWSLCCPRDSQESSPASQFEGISSLALCLLYSPALTTDWETQLCLVWWLQPQN